jgi:quercetin dioxygenase-like cupin family protein
MPATIQVISGEVMLTLGPDSCQAGPGSLAHMAPQLMHGIVANTPAVVLLTLLKTARKVSKSEAD